MTEEQKKLEQEKHRLQEALARNKEKERKLRTRRLIQEGAILEKVFPFATDLELPELEQRLFEIAKRCEL